MLVLDIECFSNYFLLEALNPKTQETFVFESYPGHPLDTKGVLKLMESNLTVGFNSFNYDLPMLSVAVTGADNQTLKDLSDKIITSRSIWEVMREEGIGVPSEWRHIDLIELAIGQASLKIYGGRLFAKKMQDLPISPDELIRPEDRPLIRKYCLNDLETTHLLYQKLKPQLDLRKAMGEMYGLNLMSKSDAKIAETLIRHELEALTKQRYSAPQLPDTYKFKYRNPRIIQFQSKELEAVYHRVRQELFGLEKGGSVAMPDWLAEQKIHIGKAVYQMGIGGLHSCEKSQYFEADEEWCIGDWDVASMYPSIILQQRLAPGLLGEPFLKLYEGFVKKRIEAKRSGNKTLADTYKIILNSSYGKFGSKYSFLYSPDLLAQTTLTGQFSLLMLIERLETEGFRVISANTDGLVVYFPRAREREVEYVMWDWMLDTSYELERTDYVRIAFANINNYVAVKLDGGVKGKGIFAEPSMSKNPDGAIIYQAVANHIASGASIEETIMGCTDVALFCTVRRVTGGAVWRGEPIGKAIRFLHSTEGDVITYAKNGNKVPNSDGCRPLMELPSTFPKDVDYGYYLNKAYKLLKEVGYERA